MKEFINVAHASGTYNGKPITATSNPWKIKVKHKHHCICECVCQTLCVCDLCCIIESYAYYNGIKEFVIFGRTVIQVRYGICIKYVDCHGNKKTVTKEGNVMFFELPEMFSNNYTVHIPNPPCVKVCGNTVIAEFPVILCN